MRTSNTCRRPLPMSGTLRTDSKPWGAKIMAQVNVNFEVEIQVAERGENLYAATIMPFHVTGYGDTFDNSIDRAKEGLDHLLKAYEDEGNLESFLNESGIEYTLAAETPAVDGSVRQVREQIAYAGSH